MIEAAFGRLDIIIPVYRGETAVRRCLDSVLSSDAMELADVVIINDDSPEPGITAFLDDFAAQRSVSLINHDVNQGFVACVNAAAALHPDRDFVILNADTEVASDWLQRLVRHGVNHPRAATITPFSNNATIASYPKLVTENALPRGEDIETLYKRFARANDGEVLEMPTAIGFCTWIRRSAWEEVSGFDAVFGRGYGEEVDFCCKLAATGWQHFLATDIFIFHEGGVSFGAEANELKANAQKIIDERYPDYGESIQRWIHQDPSLAYRLAVDIDRLSERSGPRWLFISHAYSGGVKRHIDDLAALIRDELDGVVWLLQPRDEHSLRLSWCGEQSELDTPIAHDQMTSTLPKLIAELGIQRLHFHHFVGLPASVLELPSALDLPFDFTFHDFHSVCPQTHFITREGRYCGRPDVSECEACVADRPDPWGLGIENWRITFDQWLAKADRVIYPSSSVRDIVLAYFPDLYGEIWSHPECNLAEFTGHAQRSLSRKKVALIGSMSDVKGLHRLQALAEQALSDNDPVEFVVIGPILAPFVPVAPGNVVVTGEYEAAQLPSLLARERPDVLLFLSVVPETYNFALSAALVTGLPIVALDAGAIGERLQDVAGATVLPIDAKPADILGVLGETAGPYTLSEGLLMRGAGHSNNAAYVARHHQPIANLERKMLLKDIVLAQFLKMIAEAPQRKATERGMSELLERSLDCRLSEATVQLRKQAMQNEMQLAERNAHVSAMEREKVHLETVIDELKSAQAAETLHLKHIIAEVQATSAARDEELAQQSERVRELETSTSWRITAPLRMIVQGSRSVAPWVRTHVEWCRRVLVFARYHYGHGGWPALRDAIERRLASRSDDAKRARFIAKAGELASPPEGPIVFQESDRPIVSIIIPTYGDHQVTRRCLASLAEQDTETAFEVLVVDDAFDEPLSLASIHVSGAQLIRNAKNLGFLRTCNRAVGETRGDYILLLNNDTVVHAGAVNAMLESFAQFDSVGAVCAQLRFANGSLQEAGGIVWSDGSAWNWGRGENPRHPRFNYPREVDYGSAAALMVPRKLWERLGGFDEDFAPAYYEDTDLCFAIRSLGHRVIYQPLAVVTHLEGVSHGTDIGVGIKAYQVRNKQRFADKWNQVLRQHRANGVEPMLERDRPARARILWVEACMLTPDQDSGSLRTIRLLRILVRMGCKVTYVADNLDGAEPYRSQLTYEGIEVIHAPFFSSVSDYLTQHGAEFDIVTLCRHYIAIQHLKTVRDVNPGAKIWFDTIDLHYLRLRRQFALDGKKSTVDRAELAYREEMEVISHSDLTVVVSEVEASELADDQPDAKVAVISNIHEVAHARPGFDDRNGVVFVGGFQHPPNIDAVEYYANEIWPLLTELCPDLETYIIGSRMPNRLKKIGESKGLKMLGFVEDLTPYYESCKLAIAPLRYGAGVKGKVNQALSFGLPVVGSPNAVEGMGLTHEREVMVAETPECFADSVANVCNNRELWQALSERGAASLVGRFTPEVAEEALRHALAPWLDERNLETAG